MNVGAGVRLPEVSVVIPTRNRPDEVIECVASVLTCNDENFTVTVVDQSDDVRSSGDLEALGEGRVRHVPTTTRGAAAARNLGATRTSGEIIAYTDDDCRVDPHWISSLRAALGDPSVGMAFGRVTKGPPPAPDAFAAEFLSDAPSTLDVLPPVSEPWGISASVALRRSCFEETHGFDEELGPGSRFQTGGEDSGLFIRVLAAGYRVRMTTSTTITHLGFRSGADASALQRGYAFALGAVFMKDLRLRTKPGRDQLARWLLHLGRGAGIRIVRRRTPTGMGFMVGLLKGAWCAARTPIDRTTSMFIPSTSPVVSEEDHS